MSKSVGFVPEHGVDDVEASVAFYRDVLGCQLVEKAADDGGWSWAEVSLGESRLMFQRASILAAELPWVTPARTKPRAVLVLRIEPSQGAEDLLARVKQAGRAIDSGPTRTDYGSYEFSFRDPDDFVVVVAGRD